MHATLLITFSFLCLQNEEKEICISAKFKVYLSFFFFFFFFYIYICVIKLPILGCKVLGLIALQ